MRVEKLISEAAAPWIANTVGFLVAGVSSGMPIVGVVGAVLTGPVPMSAILWMVKRGVLIDHHASERAQRNSVFLVLFLAAATVGAVLLIAGSTRALLLLWEAGMFSTLVLWIVTSLCRVKASVHVAVWTVNIVALSLAVSPWLWGFVTLIGVVAWGRVKVGAHSRMEVAIGAIIGLVATVIANVL